MQNAEIFSYVDYRVGDDKQGIVFSYKIEHDGEIYHLNEKLYFPEPLSSTPEIKNALRALHLALGISYYKIFLTPTIEHPYAMDENEAEFWNDVYVNGLGEFLYVNKLPAERIARFTAQNGIKSEVDSKLTLEDKALLGIGGGKDSIAAGELLKKIGVPVEGFVMATGEQLGQSKSVAEVMKIPLHAVGRTLDPQLMNLQMLPGAYRGHIPISLIFGLVGTVLALSQKASFVVVANEASASIPGVQWQGKAVNHQWSKSFEFEKSLQNYIKRYIGNRLCYFSVIRPLTSVAVARQFAKYAQYFEVFTSDNYVFRIDPSKRPNGRWSLESPKSLSSFILLAPWIDEEAMLKIFGRNFLNEPSLEALFLSLVGAKGEPPLDCVGTVDEMVLSLNLLNEKNLYVSSHLMALAEERGVIKAGGWKTELNKYLKPVQDQAFPDSLKDKLNTELQ